MCNVDYCRPLSKVKTSLPMISQGPSLIALNKYGWGECKSLPCVSQKYFSLSEGKIVQSPGWI